MLSQRLATLTLSLCLILALVSFAGGGIILSTFSEPSFSRTVGLLLIALPVMIVVASVIGVASCVDEVTPKDSTK